MRLNRGFTLIEALVAAVIVAILATTGILLLHRYRHMYVFQQYASELEMNVRRAKILAMERSTNIGVCVSSNRVEIRDIGTQRGAGICSGNVISSINVSPSDDFISFTGSGFSFDPRGFAIFLGNVCIQNTKGNNFLLICVSRFGGIRTQKGTGPCPQNCT